jgi:hypothetical protein
MAIESLNEAQAVGVLLNVVWLMFTSQHQNAIAKTWFAKFEEALTRGDIGQLLALFHPDKAYWRDILTFSWDYRNFDGPEAIRSYLEDGNALKKAQLGALKMEGALFVEATPGQFPLSLA